tara:strand:+ start:28198 stop:31512 length:3315 start_codon:yes stop_codon:yes gene_type:complete
MGEKSEIQNDNAGKFISMQIRVCRTDCVLIDGSASKTFDVRYLYNGDDVHINGTHGNLFDFVDRTALGTGQIPQYFDNFGDANLYCQAISSVDEVPEGEFPDVTLNVKVANAPDHELKEGREKFVFYIDRDDAKNEASPYTASGVNLGDCLAIAETIESASEYVASETHGSGTASALLTPMNLTVPFGITTQSRSVILVTPSEELEELFWAAIDEDYAKDVQTIGTGATWKYSDDSSDIVTVTTISNDIVTNIGQGDVVKYVSRDGQLYKENGWLYPLNEDQSIQTTVTLAPGEYEIDMLTSEISGLSAPVTGNITPLDNDNKKFTLSVGGSDDADVVLRFVLDGEVMWDEQIDSHKPRYDHDKLHSFSVTQKNPEVPSSPPGDTIEYHVESAIFGKKYTESGNIDDAYYISEKYARNSSNILPKPHDYFTDGGCVCQNQEECGDQIAIARYEFENDVCGAENGELISIPESGLYAGGHRFNWYEDGATPSNYYLFTGDQVDSILEEFPVMSDSLSKCTSTFPKPDDVDEHLHHPCRKFRYVRIDPVDIDHTMAPETNPVIEGEFYPSGFDLCPDSSDMKNNAPRYTDLDANFNAVDANFDTCCFGRKSECDSSEAYAERTCKEWWWDSNDSGLNTSPVCGSGLEIDSIITAGLTDGDIRSTAQFYVSAGPCPHNKGQVFYTKYETKKTYADGNATLSEITELNDGSPIRGGTRYGQEKNDLLVENTVEDISDWTPVFRSNELAFSTQTELNEMTKEVLAERLVSKTVTITMNIYENVGNHDDGNYYEFSDGKLGALLGTQVHTTDNLLVPAPDPDSTSPLYDNPTWAWDPQGSSEWQVRVKSDLPDTPGQWSEWSDVTEPTYTSDFAYEDIRGGTLTLEVQAYLTNSSDVNGGTSATGTHSVEIYNVYQLVDCLSEHSEGGYFPDSPQIRSLSTLFSTGLQKDVWAGYFADNPGEVDLGERMCVAIYPTTIAPEETASILDYDSSHFHDECECCAECANGESESSSIQELSCCPEVYQGYEMCEFPEEGDAGSADPVIYIGPASKSKSFAKFITYEGHCYRKFGDPVESSDHDIIVSYDGIEGTSFCCDDPHICTFFGDKYEM